MAPRRPWDNPWRKYPASKPLRPDEGIATSRQRGEMAGNWWSRRLVELVESYGLGARMQRGRRYARQGQLVSFEVHLGLVLAQVQGSRRTPYAVSIAAPILSNRQWGVVQDAMQARAALLAQLLAGHVPLELEAVFADAGVDLLPAEWDDLRAACSCPDSENPCKHVAAVLYVFADRLDDDPWQLLRWRGRERDEILDHLRAGGVDRTVVAPWWPLVPGAPLPADQAPVEKWAISDPSAALTRLGPLDVQIRSRPVTDYLAAAYTALAETN